MAMAVLLLRITALLFVAFGVAFAIAPEDLADLITGSTPATSSGVIDMRATYGGVALGIGLFVGYCARRAETVRLGLVAALLVLVGLAGTRLLGIVADGSPNGFMIGLLAAEIAFVSLLWVSIRRLGAR